MSPAAATLEYVLMFQAGGGKKDKAVLVGPRVVSVVWRTFQDNRPIDRASETPNGEDPEGGEPAVEPGWRIFPERKTPDDPKNTLTGIERETVEVMATIVPPTKNIPVYFTWWDVDDPSGVNTPVDLSPDDAFPIGVDNREDSRLFKEAPMGGILGEQGRQVTKHTDADWPNRVLVYLRVSPRPGDNYKVTATNWQHINTKITQEIVDRAGIGANTIPKGAAITEMLTTWRTLHIEPDSLGDGSEEGPFDEAGPWENNSDPNVNWDWFPGDIGTANNQNEFFTKPSLEWLTEQMARCYIEIAEDLGTYDIQENAAFERHLPPFTPEGEAIADSVRDVDSLVDFWTVQVFAAYEGFVHGDEAVLIPKRN